MRTRVFVACIAAFVGWIYAAATDVEAQVVTPYDRSAYVHWDDADKDCENTRAEVLIHHSVTPVTYRDNGCTVDTGTWLCPYTGKTITKASELQVDHVWALYEAHYAGGWLWSKAKKKTFANDMDNLLPVASEANQAKGHRPPSSWRPDDLTGRCEFAVIRRDIARKYGLTETPMSDLALTVMAETCQLQ